MIDVARYKKRLLVRRAELQNRLDGIEADLDETPSADWEERATEREGDEVLEELGAAGAAELRMIAAALDRIEAGTFGECVACGAEISAERLDVLPHAPRCRHCAGK
jgi:RNA polymerase-binding transcription factor DksA